MISCIRKGSLENQLCSFVQLAVNIIIFEMNLNVYEIKQQTVTGGGENDEKQIWNNTTES